MMMAGDLNDIRKVVTDLECEKNQVICANQSLSEELAHTRKELCEHRKIEEKMRENLEEAQQNIKCLKKENCKLEDCLRTKDAEICDLRKLYATIDELSAYVSRLEKEIDCKSKQRCALEEQIADLNRCIQEKDMYIRRIESKICELEGTLADMEDDIRALQEENDCLKADLEECRNLVDKKSMDLECMCQRLRQCECEKHKIQSQLAGLHQALEERKEALCREQQCTCKLKEQLKRQQAENHKLCMDNSCLQEENCELTKKLEITSRNLKKRQCEYDRMVQECQACKKSIGEFKKQIVMDLKCSPLPECCGVPPKCCGERSRSNYTCKSLQRPLRPRAVNSFEFKDVGSSVASMPRCEKPPGCCPRLTSTFSGLRKGGKKCGECPATCPACPTSQRCCRGGSPAKKYCKSGCKKY